MLRPSKSLPKTPSPTKPPKQQTLLQHRKQIQRTLNQLYRLQSQIYQLNVPQNPHSSSPVKKQIKQLSYLYQNMTKPKVKNGLGVRSDHIELALRLVNKDWTPDTKLQPEIAEGAAMGQIDLLGRTRTQAGNTTVKSAIRTQASMILSNDRSYKAAKTNVQAVFQALTRTPLNIDFISKNQKSDTISTKQLYQFLNFTECDSFDPVQQAYQMFLNQEGEFDLKIYNQINEQLGLPKIKNINTFIAAINNVEKQSSVDQVITKGTQAQSSGQDHQHIVKEMIGGKNNKAKLTLEQFRKVLGLQF